jgi:aminoglycoside N3'-acetyltransferase
LDALDVTPGDVIFLHTSFSRLRYLGLSPAAFIDALLARLTASGTLAMPSYTWNLDPSARPWKGYADYFARQPAFDVRATPSNMGVVPETFRTLDGVRRSVDYWWPVCVRGRLAAEIVADQHHIEHPFGPGSAFARLHDAGVKMLGLGVTLNTTSLALLTDFQLGSRHPHRVFTETPQRATVTDHDGKAVATRSFWLLPEVVRRIKPAAVLESPRSAHAVRRMDQGTTVNFCYPFGSYHREAMRLAAEATATGQPLPWLRDYALRGMEPVAAEN